MAERKFNLQNEIFSVFKNYRQNLQFSKKNLLVFANFDQLFDSFPSRG